MIEIVGKTHMMDRILEAMPYCADHSYCPYGNILCSDNGPRTCYPRGDCCINIANHYKLQGIEPPENCMNCEKACAAVEKAFVEPDFNDYPYEDEEDEETPENDE